MHGTRGKLEVETLLKIVLALVAVLLLIEVVSVIISGFLAILRPLLIVAILAVIVLWLLDRL
ncbi:DUF7554 family protein [Natronorubrum tibetense]|uniref:Uncharacterized protein n=1 Tax=Natronorubrum tibetense GA33 TaxID=1114856 RepID=L9VH70_9EURY|nr:hypothetical protein [Natronorubrum tibetense]ELY36429.1 hypothetical protein C496_21107 [Natronorubrum tibetense GA33]